jgi:hypothetical protein
MATHVCTYLGTRTEGFKKRLLLRFGYVKIFTILVGTGVTTLITVIVV